MTTTRTTSPRVATVVVLGDLGRSPRMQYHALSLLEELDEGARVNVVGLAGEDCLPRLERERGGKTSSSSRCELIRLSDDVFSSQRAKRLPWALRAPLRSFVNATNLLLALLRLRDTDLVLVQDPPSVPTLLVVWFVFKFLRNDVAFVIDWHNLGYKMLERPASSRSWRNRVLVEVARRYELLLARGADRHLCVTSAMKDFLATRFSLEAERIAVLYDRPHEEFKRMEDVRAVRVFLERLGRDDVLPRDVTRRLVESRGGDGGGGETSSSRTRIRLLVSSTSWTPDEDFSIMLDALEEYARRAASFGSSSREYSPLVVVVTGKGPLKGYYLEEIARRRLAPSVEIHTAWLAHEDYPRLLGCADLGLSMHTSTSGIDLPMKVLDMFGCELPVLAAEFQCIDELVVRERNGLVFASSRELADQLERLFARSREESPSVVEDRLAKLRRGVVEVNASRGAWHENWVRNALPTLRRAAKEAVHRPPSWSVARISLLFFLLSSLLGGLGVLTAYFVATRASWRGT